MVIKIIDDDGFWYPTSPGLLLSIFHKMPRQVDKKDKLKLRVLEYISENNFRINDQRIKLYIINELNGKYKYAIRYKEADGNLKTVFGKLSSAVFTYIRGKQKKAQERLDKSIFL